MIDYFTKCNESIIEKLEEATKANDTATETNLVLGNALLVYELTDFVIDYIEQFRLTGLPEVLSLHQATLTEIAQLREQEKLLRQQADVLESDDNGIREQTLASIIAREGSLDVLEHEWNNYVESVRTLDQEPGSVKSKLPALKLIREMQRIR